MPRLLLFGTCQKAIMDKADSSVSMIGLINGITIQITDDQAMTEDAAAPLQWSTVASWMRMPEDEGKTFLQKVTLSKPNGEENKTFEGEPFVLHQRFANSITTTFGFPIREQGMYTLTLYLKEADTNDWREVTTSPFDVVHNQVEVNPNG